MRHNYENLEIYKRSLLVATTILSVIDDVRPFRLAEQITSSSISVPSNIAEGSERGSNKEFIRFLQFSSGSSSELATQLTIIEMSGKKIGLDLTSIISEIKEINSMIRGFMNTLGKSNV
jgi:four helix bundle protein